MLFVCYNNIYNIEVFSYGMLGVNKVNQQKERILSIVKMKGPSLPLQIARGIGADGLFTSAFLSELYSEKKLKMSSMKVGSSQLYFLEGQETMLENFIHHLNIREQEAFSLLKNEKVLQDEMQAPVVRVALRAIKDFAIAMRVRINGDSKIFWKYSLLPDTEFERIVTDRMMPAEKVEEKKKAEEKKARVEEKTEDEVKKVGKRTRKRTKTEKAKTGEVEKKGKVEETKKEDLGQEVEEGVGEKIGEEDKELKSEVKDVEKSVEKKAAREYEFSKIVRRHLAGREIEIFGVVLEKNKEFSAKVSANIIFGRQEMMLFAKDKKSVTDVDLALALQKAQAEKMPALVLSSGELNKKAKEYLKDWGNLVKFEKMGK